MPRCSWKSRSSAWTYINKRQNKEGTVRAKFFRQKPDGPELIGTIELKDGRLIADPPDAPSLRMALDEDIRKYETSGRITLLNSKLHAEEFIKELPMEYHGTYFWAEL